MKDWVISSEKHVYDTWAYTVGFFLGDGSLSNLPFKSSKNGKTYFHNDVVFVCSDPEPIYRVQKDGHEIIGKKYSITKRNLNSGIPHWRVSFHRRDVFDWFAVNTNWRSEIPAYYFSCEKEIQKQVLQGLMDSDGHCAEFVDKGGSKNGVKRWMLGFSNTKLSLIENTASLFQRVGVRVGKISEANKKGYRPNYIIRPNMRDFHECGLSFLADRKQQKFNRYVSHVLGSETLRAAPLI